MKEVNKMKEIKRKTNCKLIQSMIFFILALICFGGGIAAAIPAAATGGLGTIADNITSQFGPVAKLIVGGAYIAGFGFALASILKFKAHKDNPTQVPVGTPIALLFIAVALIFIPSLMKMGGVTVFGAGAKQGHVSGMSGLSGV
jgi:intracellular multiplication protein IcmD